MTAVLRAQVNGENEYDDPSEDGLLELLNDLQPDDFLIVERLADASGQTYAQVLRTDDRGYLLERRDGSEQTHAHTRSTELGSVHADLTTWAHGVARPYTLPWSPGLAE